MLKRRASQPVTTIRKKPRAKPVAIMLRGLDPELVRRIDERARRDGISRTRAAVRLLETGAGLGKKRRPTKIGHALDKYIGTWTEEDEHAFRSVEADFERIDPEMWK